MRHCPTEKSLQGSLREIPFGGLPQTLKDAVAVTRSLGLGYLWVDSLCIVQDDETQKARAIGHMGSIYAGAVITITASCSKRVQDGF